MRYELLRDSQGNLLYRLMDHNDKARKMFGSARVYRLMAVKTGKY
jgi:hypothetical protein